MTDAAARNRSAPLGVLWEGEFFVAHSLALVNRELALALLESGAVDLGIAPADDATQGASAQARDARLMQRLRRTPDSGVEVHVRHQWPPRFERPAAGRLVVMLPWEFGRLPSAWAAALTEQVDEVWAPSEHVRRTHIDSGVPAGKVHRIANGVDAQRFRPDAEPMTLATRKGFRFLFVGGAIWRKGFDVLLEAYSQAFSARDDVCLVLKDFGADSFYAGGDVTERVRALRADPEAPEVLYLDATLSDAQMPSLYAACDALAHPYRGEGFGLPIAEAMACGLPPIVTRGGAADDFCSEHTALWVDATRRPVSIGTEAVGQPWVLEPDRDALIEQLLACYEDRAMVERKGRAASDWVRANLTWEHSAQQALRRLHALAGR